MGISVKVSAAEEKAAFAVRARQLASLFPHNLTAIGTGPDLSFGWIRPDGAEGMSFVAFC